MDLILQSEASLDQDRMTMQFIIIALLVVAVLLGFLTYWYWKQTDPRKAAARRPADFNHTAYPEGDGFEYSGQRGPVVTQGPGTGPTSTPSSSGGDTWAALTSAEPNGSKKR